MDDEIDGAVLGEIRIIRFLAEETGEELVAVRTDGDESVLVRLGMLDMARDTFLREGADGE